MGEFIEAGSPIQLILSGLMMLVLIFPFRIALIKYKKAKESKYWSIATGLITKSEIKSYRDDEGEKMYILDFEYSYLVNNKQYFSKGRFLDEEYGRSWIGKLQNFVDNNKANQNIKVYYDPYNPENSVVIYGLKPRHYLEVLVYLIFIISGVILISVGLNKI